MLQQAQYFFIAPKNVSTLRTFRHMGHISVDAATVFVPSKDARIETRTVAEFASTVRAAS
jgi:hypothetical protein